MLKATPRGGTRSTSVGKLGAVTLPSGREEARALLAEHPDKVALSATTTWLPPVIASWLICLESAPKDMEGRLLRKIEKPTLSETETTSLTQCLKMLELAMRPASNSPEALVEAIRIALAEVHYRSKSSEDDWALTIKIWASKCGEYPLWAVQKAAGWWASGARDSDQLCNFLTDVRLAVGAAVLNRHARLVECVGRRAIDGKRQ